MYNESKHKQDRRKQNGKWGIWPQILAIPVPSKYLLLLIDPHIFRASTGSDRSYLYRLKWQMIFGFVLIIAYIGEGLSWKRTQPEIYMS